MGRDLFRPWLAPGRLWRSIAHVLLDLPVATFTFTVVVSLLATAVGTIIVVPLALVVAGCLLVSTDVLGRMERSRAAALLGVDVPCPHLRPTSATFLGRLGRRATSASRWKEVVYFLVHLPVVAVLFTVVMVVWCGSLALVSLPAYAGSLPTGAAEFGLFHVGPGGGAFVLAAAGLVGLALVAPWATWGAARVDELLVRGLLGPPADQLMAREVQQLEERRAAAVGTAESERARIERDLHDGAQQRLVALAMDLGMARERFDTDPESARALVDSAHTEAKAALAELRNLVRGFQPAILSDRGLDAALSSVVARVPIPVEVRIDVEPRPPAEVESAAYFVVAEALTNITRHARATAASVSVERRGGRLAIAVTDDGVGGADPRAGTGLAGLAERVRALGGNLHLVSPVGGPTSILVELPCAS